MKDKQLLKGMIGMLATVALAFPSEAGIIWKADFESYSGGGDVILNASGDNDTFSSFTGSSGFLSPAFTAMDASAYGLANGLSGKFTSTTATTTDKHVWLNQGTLGSYGEGSFLALSFDMVRPSDSVAANLLITYASADGDRATSGFLTLYDNQFTGSTKAGRVTLVMNQTGSSIVLPGTLGSLGNGMVAVYGKNNGASDYVGLATASLEDTTINGFIIDQLIKANTPGMYHLYDNMALFDSASDTVGGTGVLELDFGTVVPEPATIGLLGTGVLIALLRRRLMR